jgi:hypothetical protein
MNNISHVIVRENGALRATYVAGRIETYLAIGRYDCEGCVERGGSSHVRLRSGEGDLYLISERQLLRTSGQVRRVYRGCTKVANSQELTAGAETHEITRQRRSEVRQQQWASQPFKRRHLGTYLQFGSQDEWGVEHYIERADGQWTVTVESPNDYEESVSSEDLTELIEGVADLGYDVEDFISDLRKTREPQLAALAEEIEREQ